MMAFGACLEECLTLGSLGFVSAIQKAGSGRMNVAGAAVRTLVRFAKPTNVTEYAARILKCLVISLGQVRARSIDLPLWIRSSPSPCNWDATRYFFGPDRYVNTSAHSQQTTTQDMVTSQSTTTPLSRAPQPPEKTTHCLELAHHSHTSMAPKDDNNRS